MKDSSPAEISDHTSMSLEHATPFRIAVVGAGSIGLYYGTKLAASGCEVRFLMRSGFEEAKSSGIHVYSQLGDNHLRHPEIFLKAEDIAPVDCVLISVKSTTNSILEHILPHFAPNAIVMTLQNGLGNEEFLSRFVSPSQILGALCFVCLTRSSPAAVHHQGHGSISIGEFSENRVSPRVETLVALFKQAGIQAKPVANLLEERWRKLVWNIPFNGLSVTEGQITVDRILSTPRLLSECKHLMQETLSAANALGLPIEAEYQEMQLKRTATMGPYSPSTLIDFQAGRELEIEAIWGIPLRKAKSVGLEMPHLSRLYQRLCELNPTPST